jgi:Ca-activated chloride channel family protein
MIFLLGSVGFLLLTLARPLIYSKSAESEMQGIPYMIAIDASRSMLATDVKPTRYAAVSNALDRWLGEIRVDQVGLITFAGEGYLNAPLTFDTTALQTILRYVEPEDLTEGGSSLALAIERTAKYFASNDVPQRVLIIISDGEELEGNAIEAARKARREQHLVISTVGVGTTTGARIPATRKSGGRVQRNSFGQEVSTRLDEGNLRRIALAGGGRYYAMGADGAGLNRVREEVLMPLREAASKDNLQNYRELYQIPAALSLACILLRLWLRPESQRCAALKRQPVIR